MDIFKQFADGEIMRVVTTRAQRFHEPMAANLSFVAVKGEIGIDWTIYVGKANQGALSIKQWGDKVHSADIIRNIMPCDDDVFKLYRY